MNKILKIFLFLILVITSNIISQNKSLAFKNQAILLMKGGRYGEAVDLLNKYIAANPREADGYHNRGLCYEQKINYENAVLDLKRARTLDPANISIKNDLDRVIGIWHRELYQKIDGHKRDIAIDPKHAFSYLEIGKCYRWLEDWSNAEIWYDEYLNRDDNASPDEIIRYTEILAKTGSIIKGERILKKFVARYPEDWRLWSRYGYFTYWLGKYKIAEDAFTASLGFKPFFKEAADGLDLAKREGYLTQYQGRAFEKSEYPIDRYTRILRTDPDNDDIRFNLVKDLIGANRYEEAYQNLQYLQTKHSDDDKFKSYWKNVTENRDSTFNKNVEVFTGRLKENPADKEAVMKLAEAYGNLFYYDNAIEVLTEYLQDLPEDQDLDARFKFAQYAAWNYEWEKAIAQLQKLLQYDPNNIDYQLLRGQIAVWTVNDLDMAEQYLLNVHDKRPNDMNAIIGLVSLYSWEKKFSEAKKYLEIAQAIAPRSNEVENAVSNFEIHVAAEEEVKVFGIKGEAEKLTIQNKCPEALAKFDEYKSKRTALTRDELIEYADIASCAKEFNKAIEAYDKILAEKFDYKIALQRAKNYFYNHDSSKAVVELENLSHQNPNDDEARLFLADAYTQTDQLEKAEDIYRDYAPKIKDESDKNLLDQRMIFLGESYVKDKNFEKASEIFNEVANSSEDSLVQRDLMQRRLYLGSALIDEKKLDEAQELFSQLDQSRFDTDLKKDFNQRKLILGDAFVASQDYSRAEDIYDEVLNSTNDTTQQRLIKERISWIPPYGINRGFHSIGSLFALFLPTNIGLSPFTTYYTDNQKFHFWNYGMRLDAGFIGILGLGASWSRTNLDNLIASRNFSQLKGLATIKILNSLSLFGSYGILNIPNEANRKIGDAGIRFEKQDEYSAVFSFENNDTRMILYSPNLIYSRLGINYYRLNGLYNYKNLFRISALYNYFSISDNNEGNDLQIRLGKMLFQNGLVGYEYYFSSYKFVSPLYYSPRSFESHSIWAEWTANINKFKLKAGGKLGYVPAADFVVSELYGETVYNPITRLIITCRLSYGNSFRYDSSYKSFAGTLYAYFGIY